jgi:hypothetical protein
MVFSTPSQVALYSMHKDHRCSLRAIADQSDQIVNTNVYHVYGNAEAGVESLPQAVPLYRPQVCFKLCVLKD